MTQQKITSIKQLIPPPSKLPIVQAGRTKTVSRLINDSESTSKYCHASTMRFEITIWKDGMVDIEVDAKDGVKAEITVPAKDFFAVLDKLGFEFKQEEGQVNDT